MNTEKLETIVRFPQGLILTINSGNLTLSLSEEEIEATDRRENAE